MAPINTTSSAFMSTLKSELASERPGHGEPWLHCETLHGWSELKPEARTEEVFRARVDSRGDKSLQHINRLICTGNVWTGSTVNTSPLNCHYHNYQVADTGAAGGAVRALQLQLLS